MDCDSSDRSAPVSEAKRLGVAQMDADAQTGKNVTDGLGDATRGESGLVRGIAT